LQALHTANMAQTKQHTVFFHPDLGIGGAERLVVDAAVALQERGHKVTIFTSHCDPRHCFDEARDGKFPLRLTAIHRLCTDKAAET
jgi:alpha-1,3/alpha-1,6-mannosyltransferase